MDLQPTEDIDSRLSFNFLRRSKSKEAAPVASWRELDLYYKLKHPTSRGKCLILNYKSFSPLASSSRRQLVQRPWSKLDVEWLKSTFEQLKFNVQLEEDLTYNKTIRVIQTESKSEHNKDVDCLVVVILSQQVTLHQGTPTGKLEFHCTDQSMNIELLVDQLTKPTGLLAGKPKLFFVEAGNYSTNALWSDGKFRHDGSDRDRATSANIYLIPRYADCLILNVTFSGCKLSSFEENGSKYIRMLCETLRDCSHKCDLMTLLTMFSRAVQQSNGLEDGTALVQIMSTLTRLLHFGQLGM